MSFLSSLAADIRNIPELAKGAVAFASTAAAAEATLVTFSSAVHIIPPSWLQFVAAGVAGVSGVAVILADLASSSSITVKAEDILAEIGKTVTTVEADLPKTV